jgi:hypothetical protein
MAFVVPPSPSRLEKHQDDNKGRRFKPLPISLTSYRRLGGLAVNLGFENFLAANINLDLLGLGFRLLSQVYLQHALVVMGAHRER